MCLLRPPHFKMKLHIHSLSTRCNAATCPLLYQKAQKETNSLIIIKQKEIDKDKQR